MTKKQDDLKSRLISKAPPPINPVGGLGASPKASNTKTLEPQKELTLPITGTDLMKRWSVDFKALCDFVREGALCPYEPENCKGRVKYDFGMLSNAYTQQEREEYFSLWLYHLNDVEAFEAQHGKIIDAWREKLSPSKDAKNDKPVPISENSFHNKGKTWAISFKGKRTDVPDSKRVRYIAHLLSNPRTDILCSDLYTMVSGTDPDSKADKYKISSEQLEEDNGMSFSKLGPDIISEKDQEGWKKDIKSLMIRIQYADDSSNPEELAHANEDLDSYRANLLEEHGIRVNISDSGDIRLSSVPYKHEDFERIRKKVQKEIRNGINIFERDIPELREYLDKRIKTGMQCVYKPDFNDAKWNIQF